MEMDVPLGITLWHIARNAPAHFEEQYCRRELWGADLEGHSLPPNWL
jgi:hypothetical protein